MDKKSRALMLTMLLIALIQMPHLAIMPGTNQIAKEIFPEKPFETVQTVMSLSSVVSVVIGILSAMLVRYGFARKKTAVVFGLCALSACGVSALLLHTQFWQLCMFNALIGVAMGTFIPMSQSIVFDSFDEKPLQMITGLQSAFINGGGIIMSVLGGLLTRLVWYGGHLATLLAIPVVIVAVIIIPKDKKHTGADGARSKLPGDVYFYSAVILLFMIMYNVGASNLSTHIANGNIGDSGTAGIGTAAMMAGGVLGGFLFPKLSPRLRDNLFCLSFTLLFIGYSTLNLFPSSLALTIVAMFISGTSLSLLIPRCIFRVSGITDVTNSATATMFIASAAPGTGSFLSPVIITNITLAIGGESTRFRYQFAAVICLILAALLFIVNLRRDRRTAAAASPKAL